MRASSHFVCNWLWNFLPFLWRRLGDLSLFAWLFPNAWTVIITALVTSITAVMAALQGFSPIKWIFLALGAGILALICVHLVLSGIGRYYQLKRRSNISTGNGRPKIEIRFEAQQRPYESSEISHSQVLSTVSVGLKNTGTAPASNCRVYIDSIAPMPSPFYGATPIQIDGSGFVLRTDDPEKLIALAGGWGNSEKYRFLAPHSGWAESLNYIDRCPERVIEVRVAAAECASSALFRIWVDNHNTLHMKRIN